ncbi:hypothetical protein SLEP1_g51556 [Rubroshorea leprosula]|uniref:Uncharacterized protein n=1 Tax=Rubroshorea leprosula TaxID=152421 RepID=A0AAV5M6V2_9ROSI|nr:hypothetical protein SLEP1_g51556 [Rubroshorea leprosula]
MNTTTEIYNDIRSKVLRHWPNFPIGELTFMEGEEIEEQGKSLIPPFDTTVHLKWGLDKERSPLFPPSIVEEGEDLNSLPSFNDWVARMLDAKAGSSSTPFPSQPLTILARDAPPVTVPSVDLTDD